MYVWKVVYQLYQPGPGNVSVRRHHFFIRYEIIYYLIYPHEISLFVKICEKVVAPHGKLSQAPNPVSAPRVGRNVPPIAVDLKAQIN